jgi:hypothetical protein
MGNRATEKRKGKKETGWGPRGFTNQINKVQHLAAILIMGGMHTTATDTLLALTDLPQSTLLI